MSFRQWTDRYAGVIAAFGLVGVLAGCASGADKPKPAELGPNVALINVRLAWSAKIGPVVFPLDVKVNGGTITLASSEGTLVAMDGSTGQDLWRAQIAGAQIGAGAGSDGLYAAVVTRSNDLVVMEQLPDVELGRHGRGRLAGRWRGHHEPGADLPLFVRAVCARDDPHLPRRKFSSAPGL